MSDWKQNSNCCLFGCGNVTPLPWHTETRRSFLEEKRPFAVEIYNLPLLFTQREENRKECIYGSSVGRYGVLVTYSQENTMGRDTRRGGLLGDFSGEDVEKDY